MSLLPRIAHAEAQAHADQAPGGFERFRLLVAVWTADTTPLDTAWHDGSGPPTPEQWNAFKAFCGRHGQAPTLHALSHAAPQLLPMLNERGYRLKYLPALSAQTEVHPTTEAQAKAARGFGAGTLAIMRAVALAS